MQKIKEYVRKQFNIALKSKGWGDCKDSTSALTTEQRQFKEGNPTSFSIDVAIICESNDSWYRLIHQKQEYSKKITGFGMRAKIQKD